jgi:hypothetical protein
MFATTSHVDPIIRGDCFDPLLATISHVDPIISVDRRPPLIAGTARRDPSWKIADPKLGMSDVGQGLALVFVGWAVHQDDIDKMDGLCEMVVAFLRQLVETALNPSLRFLSISLCDCLSGMEQLFLEENGVESARVAQLSDD